VKQNWWKLIVVAALVAAVAVVVAVKNNAPDAGTLVAKDSGLTAPVDDRTAEEAVGTPTEEAPPKPATPTEAAKPDSSAALDEPKDGTQAAASVKTPAPGTGGETPKASPVEKPKLEPAAKPQNAKKQLPKLVDLGATKCVPCKMMAPLLEELKKEYKGKLVVVFIDVWENRGEAEKHGIQSIPTQIFYDENGKEFCRHEGFFPKEDILKTFKDNGIKL
jgi:thioredoxin 1